MDVLLHKHLAAGLATSVPLGAGSSEVKPLRARAPRYWGHTSGTGAPRGTTPRAGPASASSPAPQAADEGLR